MKEYVKKKKLRSKRIYNKVSNKVSNKSEKLKMSMSMSKSEMELSMPKLLEVEVEEVSNPKSIIKAKKLTKKYVHELIEECGRLYGFDGKEALIKLNLELLPPMTSFFPNEELKKWLINLLMI